jgi:hypothetical protein
MRGRFTAARQVHEVDVIEEGRRSGHREADCTHKEQQTTTHEAPSALARFVHLGQLLVAAPGPSQSVKRFPLAAPMGRAGRRGVLEVVGSIVGSLEACVLLALFISPREPSESRNAFLVRIEHYNLVLLRARRGQSPGCRLLA